jgi:asparagine synthase (glutamine-hydrolysing)
MCGICGIMYFEGGEPGSGEIIRKMASTLVHRGPDSDGFYTKQDISLGHRRLSIIDLTTGDQPMFNDDRSIALIFNGEIYNYLELRTELESDGFDFRTSSDSEVIVRAYEKWDTECLSHFNGAWAIAIWDEKKKRLFLSRDRLGEKPLFYTVLKDRIVFASEIKAIFASGVAREIDHSFTELYFGLMNIPAPYTFYKNVFQVEPAGYLLCRKDGITTSKYWKLPEYDEKDMLRDREKVYERFRELLTESVRIRMRSDVPFGAFLSGGLDSSSIVALMSGLSAIPVKTYTIGFHNKGFDERELAEMVAEKFGTEHHSGTVAPENFDRELEKILYHYDGPFGDSSAIPTGEVSRFAGEKVRMVLTGDGGDEVLSGYLSYKGIKLTSLYRSLPEPVMKLVPGLINLFSRPLRGRVRFRFDKVSRAAEMAGLDFNHRMARKLPTADLAVIKELLQGYSDRVTLEDYISELMSKCHYNDEFYRLMYFNYYHSLPNDYLVKVDRMSMAWSLEARVPFLDHRLIEFMAGVDKNVKMQGLERKSVLRNTIGKELPPALLKAGKKGFGIPLLDWFRTKDFELRLDKLKQSDSGLNRAAIGRIINENNTGLRNNGNFIWMMFLYDKWISLNRY